MEAEEKKSKLIREMDESERPREKALINGVKALTDAELMAIIFATGIRGKSVVDLCQEIIDDCGGLYNVTKLSPKMLASRYKGIGTVKAITLLAALQLGARASADAIKVSNPVINDASIAYDAMRHRFERIQHEEFWILLIDRAGHIIRDVCISKGGTVATTVDVKLILKSAIESLASSIILFHNHPSGTLKPSIEDDKLTKKIVDAARLIDISVHDHIIVTSTSYYSYADKGRI